MNLYSYTLRFDDGAAPNPYGGMCTLAIRKPEIRRTAKVGDWVVGFESKSSNGIDRSRHVNRKAMLIKVGIFIPSPRLIRAGSIDRLVWLAGQHPHGHGPEVTSHHFIDWAQRNGIELNHIEPGEPKQNAYIERFNHT